MCKTRAAVVSLGTLAVLFGVLSRLNPTLAQVERFSAGRLSAEPREC